MVCRRTGARAAVGRTASCILGCNCPSRPGERVNHVADCLLLLALTVAKMRIFGLYLQNIADIYQHSGENRVSCNSPQYDPSGRGKTDEIEARLTRKLAKQPNVRGMPTDVAVPISRLANCIMESDADLREVTQRTGIIGPIVGHVGDGNFHYCLAVDTSNPQEIREAKAFSDRLASRAIRMGGTCSGEHGVGYGKLKYLRMEHGDTAVRVMHTIKTALDPLNIFNPGKMGSEPGF